MKTTPTPETIRLRSDVENKLGFEVTCTRDCIILSQELKRFDQRFSLSVSTLRRFFGIIKQNNPTSYTSLNALARYTGAPSYDKWNDHHFRKINKKGKKTSEIFKAEMKSNDFDTRPETITSSIQIINEILNQVDKKTTFQLSAQKLRDINNLTYNLIKIDAYPHETWKRLNRIPRARIFTEAFPPIDFLSGIGEMYMKDYLATSSTKEERMFASSLITAGSIYTGSILNSEVNNLKPIKNYDTTVHPSPQARVLGINLLALNNGIKTATNQNKGFRSLILKGIKDEMEIWPKWSGLANIFKLRVAEWLILSNDLELLQAFYNSVKTMKSSQEISFTHDKFDVSFETFNAWVLFLLDKKEEAMNTIETIDLEKLSIHEERTISIYYYALTSRLYSGNKGRSSMKYLDLLTEQTRYYGLRTMLNLIN
jgi:hypothetical protein